MGKKRKNVAATSDNSHYNKRQRPSCHEGDEDETSSPSTIQPRVDPTYGQRGAFPGLDDDGDELFYGPANDGLEYLKMVRSEARSVPNLLVAPKAATTSQDSTPRYSAALDESRGYYADGAYTAMPTLGPSLPASHTTGRDDEQDPQEAYYARLRLRFSLLRATLRCTPPAERIAALDDNHPISLPVGSKHAFATWRRLLATTDPVPAQLASLDHGCVLRVLGIVTKELKRGKDVERRAGAWVWGLLGRCREVGECGSEEVGVLRELGKRAVWVLRGWREGRDQGRDGEGVGGLDGQSAEDEEEGAEQIAEHDEHGDGHGQDEDGAADPQQSPIITRSLDDGPRVKVPIPDTIDTSPAPLSNPNSFEGLDAPIPAPNPSIRDPEPRDVGSPNDVTVSDNPQAEVDELAAAKERITARLEETTNAAGNEDDQTSETEDVTLATLDMILTVVGEFYGQRDLLEFRDLWDEMF